jgi:hypothetical protein
MSKQVGWHQNRGRWTVPSRAGATGRRPARTLAHATISNKDRKQLLRTLIADIILLPEADRAKARIGIHWRTGATDDITVTQRRAPLRAASVMTGTNPAPDTR